MSFRFRDTNNKSFNIMSFKKRHPYKMRMNTEPESNSELELTTSRTHTNLTNRQDTTKASIHDSTTQDTTSQLKYKGYLATKPRNPLHNQSLVDLHPKILKDSQLLYPKNFQNVKDVIVDQ